MFSQYSCHHVLFMWLLIIKEKFYLFVDTGKQHWLAPTIIVSFFVLVPVWAFISSRNAYTKEVLYNGWSPVLAAMMISRWDINPFRTKTPNYLFTRGNRPLIVSSNWQQKFLYFHYKSVKLVVLGRQNKIWTFGNPFQSKNLPICT